MAVLRYAPTMLAPIYAVVTQGTDLLLMDVPAVVSYSSIYTVTGDARVHPTHVEINECAEGIDGCSQTCTNSPGSYSCSCRSGFVLSADSRGCDG